LSSECGVIRLGTTDLESIINHCRREYPNEACGILAGAAGRVEKVYPVRNARPSPVSYEMDPEEQFRVMKDIRDAGFAMVGIFHSHPASPAYPSGIDVEKAYWPETLFPNYPEAVYVIVSLMDRRHPVVKGFSIVEGTVNEVLLRAP
jgi:[CysO sulfur-carrier protein]-S-L-cysteine hydrolase